MKCLLTIGLSASGKTTWSEEFVKKNPNYININRDNIRFSLFGCTQGGWKSYKFTKQRESLVTKGQESLIRLAAEEGKSVVLSDTNLRGGTRDRLEGLVKSLGYKVEIKEFPIDLMEAIKRDRFRGNFSVGRDVIFKQWQQWLDYTGYEKYRPNEDLPEAIIFDVDGSLAEKGERSPFDWSKVGEDAPIKAVCDMVYGYYAQDYSIIVLSGRDSVCRTETEKWLNDNIFWYDELHMRAEGDDRKDTVVKKEFFDELKTRYNIVAAVDDRKCMVKLWEDLGVKVIEVGRYYEDF